MSIKAKHFEFSWEPHGLYVRLGAWDRFWG